jgi:DNA (cytosine-5)-methyltransferase 1
MVDELLRAPRQEVRGRCEGRVSGLVLSLFPGIGLLDMAFEEEGFCVVRGPDLLWGGDVRNFHPPAGRFDGVIGGPPCQAFSRLVHIIRAKGQATAPNLIPEYERVVGEARPTWFLMENVEDAPQPIVAGYVVRSTLYNNRWAPSSPEQNRERRFSFGTAHGAVLRPEMCALENVSWDRAVVATSSKEGALAKSQQELARGTSPRMREMAKRRTLPGQQPRRTIERCAELQGLPADWLKRFNEHSPFTASGKYRVIGNGVPLPMGRAVAQAVKRALAEERAA